MQKTELNITLMTNRWGHFAERTGVAGLYLFSLSAFLSTSGGNIGLALMLFAYILSLRTIWPSVKRDPALLLFLCFYFLYFMASSSMGISTLPFNDIIAKSVPIKKRARLFSLRQFIGGIFGMVVGYAINKMEGK